MVREYLTGIQHCMHIWPYSGIYHSQDNLQTIAIHTLYTFLLVGYRISKQSTEFPNAVHKDITVQKRFSGIRLHFNCCILMESGVH